MSYCDELLAAFAELEKAFPGYDTIIEGTLLGLLTREHVLLIGLPGSGKSQFAMSTFGMFHGAPIFKKSISQETILDDLFGNLIINKIITEGRNIRNKEGGLLTAIFAFLDELLDGPDMVLRGGLLNALNERSYMSKDDSLQHIPLHSVIATTNFNRATQALAAVLDRFLIKAFSPKLSDYTEKFGMYDSYLEERVGQLPSLDYGGLAEMADQVSRKPSEGGIQISNGFLLLHAYVLAEFEKRRQILCHEQLAKKMRRDPTAEELASAVPPLSQRTENREFDLSRAVAVLRGRSAVVPRDIGAYKYGVLTLGANPALEQLWDEVCAECIPTTEKDLRNIERLGDLTQDMRVMRIEAPQNGHLANMVGARIPTASVLGMKEFLAKRHSSHATVQAIIAQLRIEVEKIDAPVSPTSLSLSHDWQG